MNLNKNEKGLTLIELLITIAVIAIVAAISIPVITNVIDSARTSSAGSMQAQVNAFVEKYAASGEVTFDGTDTFTGWVDLNANGQVDENEAIETFKVDTAQFSLPATLDSSAPNGGDSYTDENIFPGLPSEISITAGGEAEATEQAAGPQGTTFRNADGDFMSGSSIADTRVVRLLDMTTDVDQAVMNASSMTVVTNVGTYNATVGDFNYPDIFVTWDGNAPDMGEPVTEITLFN